MILLDTDHLSILNHPSSDRRQKLVERLAMAHADSVTISIITVEEQMRGWLASIAKEKSALRQVRSYTNLLLLFDLLSRYTIMPFDEPAAMQFDQLRAQKIRIGTMDLKIAAIALSQNAILLTANRQDFDNVPGLQWQNWLE